MAINFPNSPSLDQIFIVNDTSWKWDGTSWNSYGTQLISNYWISSGVGINTISSVGIGTTNPTSKLTVSGDGLFTGIITASSFSGNATSATYATSAGVSTYASTSGVSTSVIGGIASVSTLTVSGIATFSNLIDLDQITETVVNNFNSSLSPSSGTLTIDAALGTVVLGDLSASVTTWAFTNVPTTNSKATTITVIIDGDTAQTYGDACSVNGTSITNGVKWSGGTAPTSTNNFDIISFTIVKDGAGTVNVFGSSNMNFS